MSKLTDRLSHGEPAAFAELYDLYANRLHHFLLVQLGSPADAEDALQEVFVRLTRARDKLAAVENLTAYLFTLARNEATRLRDRRKRQPAALSEPNIEELFDLTDSDFAARELAESVRSALLRLPSEQREIVDLKTYAGLTLAEIATVTDTPPGTVASRYRAALEKLRTWLATALL
ncbi:MAG: sigma-70 family RNA polymerase sigma factor [Planctomycetota bacterium]|nr:sigma-70 family RNA polymerase sigma factor [Planctomycetota bacterium]